MSRDSAEKSSINVIIPSCTVLIFKSDFNDRLHGSALVIILRSAILLTFDF